MAELLRWALGFAAILAVGCGVDPGDTNGGSAGTGGGGAGGAGGSGLDCPDDPAEGPVLPECGIWVSVSQGDDDGEGTQTAPVATLTRAIELAKKGPGRVYACNETWTEVVVVPGNVSLHGGFRCDGGWGYMGGDADRAMLLSPGPIGLTWVESGKEEKPFLTDFYVKASDAVEPGGSSFGLFIPHKEVPLTIHRSEIHAGDGVDGLDGEDGDPDGLPAATGTPGNKGADACSAPVSKGGVGPENLCDGAASNGGDGGDGGPVTATNGGAGEPAGEPPAGEGGLGEQLSPVCTSGNSGAAGANGEPGLGGKNHVISLTAQGYFGDAGKDGMLGAPGQGGGGGGATFGSAVTCGAANPGGAAGGSGGAGGCGGKGGKGGRPGGASFGIATLSIITVANMVAVAGNGGNGGNGGSPQQGGGGGLPGAGGAGMGAVKAACMGGKGGSGGKGGWGGGGAGGTSVGLAMGESSGGPLITDFVEFEFGSAGKGGKGDPDVLESDGQSGNLASYVSFP